MVGMKSKVFGGASKSYKGAAQFRDRSKLPCPKRLHTSMTISKNGPYRPLEISDPYDQQGAESDIYRMLPGADLNREQLVKIKTRRLVYF